MKTLILAAIGWSLLFVLPTLTYATSAEWDLDPISGDWNTAENWTPNGVPNGPADIATFGLSDRSDVSISEDTEVNSIIFTPAATNRYFIAVNAGSTLTVSGVGIMNNSGGDPFDKIFFTGLDGGNGQIRFTNRSTAGNAIIFNEGGSTSFFNRSTAGNSEIDNDNGTISFFDRSTAGSALIYNFDQENFFDRSTAGSAFIFSTGQVNFFDRSTAGNSGILVDIGGVAFFDRSTAGNSGILIETDIFAGVAFFDRSTAGNSFIETIKSKSPFMFVDFFDNSTAGNSYISTDFGTQVDFFGNSTAGSAVINNGHGGISFFDSSQGGTAQILLHGESSFLDISAHNAPGVTIGSLEADVVFSENARVFLGANNLTIGSNNLSTTFAGVIQDGGQNGGIGGSLTKIGTGTLILTGANTYTGDTNINRGVLQVDGSITSNTFVNQRGTLAGTGTINGNLTNTNNGRVSPGSAGSPGMLTVTGDYTQTQYAALMIQLAGANAGEFSVLNVLGTANLSDRVGGCCGELKVVLLDGFLPTVDESFTFLTAGFVHGGLFMYNRNIDNLPEHWHISFFKGFGVLTVEAGNVFVPDQGTTFVLLTLGLLGLVMCRRHCLRRFRTKRG